MESPRIVRIEWARLEGQRPRNAGGNARLGEHGSVVHVPIARITLEDGSTGFGACHHLREETAYRLIGVPLNTVFSPSSGVLEPGRPLEYPLWDLAGQRATQPVYALAAGITRRTCPDLFHAPCYDTSLYMDDLHLASTEAAARLMAGEAEEGKTRGHCAFKLKVGRGARHLPLEEGTQRDIAVIRAVREAIGPDAVLLLDANNGYNLNLTRRVLAETADCNIFWMEEAFHEDPVLYQELREWLERERLSTLIADGEGLAAPGLMEWARRHLIDVIQYDIFSPGFTRWLEIGPQLDGWGARSAPHHYGGHFGNYAASHLAGAIQGFTYVEWDEATTPGLDTSAYTIREGQVYVPSSPGFGLALDEAIFRQAVKTSGFDLS